MFKVIDLLEAEPGLKPRFLIPKLVLLPMDHSCQSLLTPLALSFPICKTGGIGSDWMT